MTTLKELIEAQKFEEAWSKLYAEAQSVRDYGEFLKLCKWRRKMNKLSSSPPVSKIIKIALLGGATTEMFEEPLGLAVESLGLGCRLFRADYNTYVQEMMDPHSATVDFAPDVAIVMTNHFNMPQWPTAGDSLEQVNSLVAKMVDHWIGLCSSLHQHSQCDVILNNFHMLSVTSMGNMGPKVPWDKNTFLKKINIGLGEQAPTFVHIHDVETCAGQQGIDQWFDSRFWYHAKQPVSFQGVIPYVQSLRKIIGAMFGRTGKCLVLDLDNTLWGGVVGDDGPEGLAIGEGDPLGEAFLAFQEYIIQLKSRGILLAVCSKNEEENARAPFKKRPEMLLKEKDFVSFKANWLPKPGNILAIAEELNIGVDSMVFVDDNPAEREHVRQQLPQVHVLELTEDPSDYAQLLDRSGWFEAVSLSEEDVNRTAQYQQNTQRQDLLSATGNYTDYLRSLQQKAVIAPFEQMYIERITQLINKSNQFNLTTKRMSRSEVEKIMEDAGHVDLYVKLSDCFGDNGLISVFIGRKEGHTLFVDIWLMSCRVLKRGVENLLSNVIVEQCKQRGITSIRGVYRPTAKNKLVLNHYQDLGYSIVETTKSGDVYWELQVDQYRPFEVQIQVAGGI